MPPSGLDLWVLIRKPFTRRSTFVIYLLLYIAELDSMLTFRRNDIYDRLPEEISVAIASFLGFVHGSENDFDYFSVA